HHRVRGVPPGGRGRATRLLACKPPEQRRLRGAADRDSMVRRSARRGDRGPHSLLAFPQPTRRAFISWLRVQVSPPSPESTFRHENESGVISAKIQRVVTPSSNDPSSTISSSI